MYWKSEKILEKGRLNEVRQWGGRDGKGKGKRIKRRVNCAEQKLWSWVAGRR